jgi:peptidoglycan/LPS O-acetylase OafA/YrhL
MPVEPSLPAGVRRSSVYLPELECLRGLAICLVMFFHADGDVRMPVQNTIGMWPSLVSALIFAGHTGVTLFFVLSAFLLSLPFLAEAAGGRRVSRADFYRRRALRILPLYWTVMVVGGVVTATGLGDVRRVVAYMLFVNSVQRLATPFHPFTTVTWSLAAEAQFYVLLPCLSLCFGSPARRRWATAALAAYLVAYLSFVFGRLTWIGPTAEQFVRNGVLGRGPLFLSGILAAGVYRRYGQRLRDAARALPPWSTDVLLVACFAALAALVRPVVFKGSLITDVTPPWFGWHTIEGVLWTMILLLVLLAPLRLRVLLVNPIFARLGLLSYSIYLLHQPVWAYTLQLARRLWHVPIGWNGSTSCWLVGATIILLGLSTLTYNHVEKPFLVRKSRLDR